MAKIINLHPERQLAKDFIFDYLMKSKDKIKDIVVLLEVDEEGLVLIHSDPDFKTKAGMSKLLDAEITKDINLEEDITYGEE